MGMGNVVEGATHFGCSLSSFHMKYLGISLECKSKAVGVCEVIIQRFQKKLSTCHRKYLLKGGRLMLIKSVLCSIPIYYMSLFQMPTSVEKQLERIMRQFFWGSVNNNY